MLFRSEHKPSMFIHVQLDYWAAQLKSLAHCQHHCCLSCLTGLTKTSPAWQNSLCVLQEGGQAWVLQLAEKPQQLVLVEKRYTSLRFGDPFCYMFINRYTNVCFDEHSQSLSFFSRLLPISSIISLPSFCLH